MLIAPNETSFSTWNSCWKLSCAMKIELPMRRRAKRSRK
jgi:hypothetical protein